MTEPQHMVALANANRVRLAASHVKREIASGELSVADALTDDRAGGIKLYDLLRAQRRWGHTRTLKLLRSLPVGELRQVRNLTARQRQALIDRLDEGCG